MFRRFLKAPVPTVPNDQRIYAIGDVHGRADLLDQLLDTIEQDNRARDPVPVTLVFLGDLIDRGPASREVFNRARAGVDWARTITLMGNHEAVMLDVLDGQSETLTRWLQFGGVETLESWGISRDAIENGTRDELVETFRHAVSPDERAWLGRMRTNLRIGDYYFVHAGIRPDVPLDRQSDEDRLWIRDDFLESKKKHGAMIVHGHSINRDVEQMPNRIGLDTGAYATGKLTAMGLQGADRWFLATGSDES